MKRLGFLLLFSLLATGSLAQPATTFTPEQQALIDEHAYGGLPSGQPILVRQGYITEYDVNSRIPKWVAYHVTPDYRNTPRRQGAFKSFRTDPDIANPVTNSDYTGLFSSRGYARGHLAPYAVMGGDRDGDGQYAAQDGDDALTIYQANYMSNIAPQHHNAFNGSGGLWFRLERWIQDELVENEGMEVWVFAGCVVGPGTHERVGPNTDITVPPMFYKVVIWEDAVDAETPTVLAFLFPHQRTSHGDIEDFLVSVDVIEALTGLDFFNTLDDEVETWLEDTDTWEFWEGF